MEEYDLWQEIQAKTKQLDTCIKELRETALRLRSTDMAVGMVSLTVYGVPEVADLRFQRDVAETVYKANLEAVNSIKLQLRLLDAQLGREWTNAG